MPAMTTHVTISRQYCNADFVICIRLITIRVTWYWWSIFYNNEKHICYQLKHVRSKPQHMIIQKNKNFRIWNIFVTELRSNYEVRPSTHIIGLIFSRTARSLLLCVCYFFSFNTYAKYAQVQEIMTQKICKTCFLIMTLRGIHFLINYPHNNL